MEIYERSGWGHPSPLVSPSEQINNPIEDVIEEAPVEDASIADAPVEDVPVEETPITPTE